MTILFDLATVVAEEKTRMFCYCHSEVHIHYFLSEVLAHQFLVLFYFTLDGLTQK